MTDRARQVWRSSRGRARTGPARAVTASENIDLVGLGRRAVEAVTCRDLDALVELLAPDCEIVPLRAAVDQTVFRGARAVPEWWAAPDDAWEGMTWELESAAEEYRQLDDERVLVLLHVSGRGKTSAVEIAQTHVKGAVVFHVRDGKVARLVQYWDRDRTLADLGLAPDAEEA
jgi:ketosteroid isomerase-like protein